MKKISDYALQSFKGFKLDSVKEIFPEIVVKAEELKKVNKNCYYVGTKNTNVISNKYIKSLEEIGLLHHTIDQKAEGGRAIDITLQNPITGRFMTGSSSGTAINVFLGVNDIGIGTDGGGSVLAPALSLNLYGFISPLIEEKYRKSFTKKSTDGIEFSPSIGFISKNIENIDYLLKNTLLKNKEKKEDLNLLVTNPIIKDHEETFEIVKNTFQKYKLVDLSYDAIDRRKIIEELQNIDFEENILISFEGPIDLYEYGDSVMGHYDNETRENQKLAHKYYLKVVNMVNLTSIIVPTSALSKGILIICKSDERNILKALEIAEKIKFNRSDLEVSYFG